MDTPSRDALGDTSGRKAGDTLVELGGGLQNNGLDMDILRIIPKGDQQAVKKQAFSQAKTLHNKTGRGVLYLDSLEKKAPNPLGSRIGILFSVMVCFGSILSLR